MKSICPKGSFSSSNATCEQSEAVVTYLQAPTRSEAPYSLQVNVLKPFLSIPIEKSDLSATAELRRQAENTKK